MKRLIPVAMALVCSCGCTSLTRQLFLPGETDFHHAWRELPVEQVDFAALDAAGTEYHVLRDGERVLVDRDARPAIAEALVKLPLVPLAVAVDGVQVVGWVTASALIHAPGYIALAMLEAAARSS